MKAWKIIVPSLLILMVGCFSIPQETLEITRYSLDPRMEVLRADTTLDLSLKVTLFSADALYRGDRIIYIDDEKGINYYYYHRWMTPPELLLGDILANNLRQWGLFGKGVLQDEGDIIPTHEVNCRLNRLYALNIRRQYSAVLEITLTLTSINPNNYDKRLVFQRQYSVSVQRDNGNISSFIPAVNAAVEEWLSQVRRDLKSLLMS